MSKDTTTQVRKSAPVFISVDNQSIEILILLKKKMLCHFIEPRFIYF